ncbi:hypothetical protein N3930_39255, partial [Bacillus thuringiensis]|nr:hypothetical protein [Bacillus thuringiensis]
MGCSSIVTYAATDLEKMIKLNLLPNLKSINSKDAVVLSEMQAKQLGLGVGDEVLFSIKGKNNQDIKASLRISTIIDHIPGNDVDDWILIDIQNPISISKQLPLRKILLDIDKKHQKTIESEIKNIKKNNPEISWGDLESSLKEIDQQ